MAVKKSGLGKGLDSLIKDNSSAKKTAAANTSSENKVEEMKSGEQMMKINMVEPNRDPVSYTHLTLPTKLEV